MYIIKQTINNTEMILAQFDDITKAENFLDKYVTILRKRDPHLSFENNQIIVHVPTRRVIQITKKAS